MLCTFWDTDLSDLLFVLSGACSASSWNPAVGILHPMERPMQKWGTRSRAQAELPGNIQHPLPPYEWTTLCLPVQSNLQMTVAAPGDTRQSKGTIGLKAAKPQNHERQ